MPEGPEGKAGPGEKAWTRWRKWLSAIEGRKGMADTTCGKEHYLQVYQR